MRVGGSKERPRNTPGGPRAGSEPKGRARATMPSTIDASCPPSNVAVTRAPVASSEEEIVVGTVTSLPGGRGSRATSRARWCPQARHLERFQHAVAEVVTLGRGSQPSPGTLHLAGSWSAHSAASVSSAATSAVTARRSSSGSVPVCADRVQSTAAVARTVPRGRATAHWPHGGGRVDHAE